MFISVVWLCRLEIIGDNYGHTLGQWRPPYDTLCQLPARAYSVLTFPNVQLHNIKPVLYHYLTTMENEIALQHRHTSVPTSNTSAIIETIIEQQRLILSWKWPVGRRAGDKKLRGTKQAALLMTRIDVTPRADSSCLSIPIVYGGVLQTLVLLEPQMCFPAFYHVYSSNKMSPKMIKWFVIDAL